MARTALFLNPGADLSPALANALKLQTDDEVDVIYPAP